MEGTEVTPIKFKLDWWLEDFHLSRLDKDRLLYGMELTDSLMNATQKILIKKSISQVPKCTRCYSG